MTTKAQRRAFTLNQRLNRRGERYGRLVIIDHLADVDGHPTYLARCDCGTEMVLTCHQLGGGPRRSCGCMERPLTETHPYRAWVGLKYRCLNPNSQEYANYGGRGITVCQEWIDSFEAFYRDMGDPPYLGMSIERIDNDLLVDSYSKANCKWATAKEQRANQRPHRPRQRPLEGSVSASNR